MGYERYPRNTGSQGDYGRQGSQDYGGDQRTGRNDDDGRAREYDAAGMAERGDRDRGDREQASYGQREYGNARYGQREQMQRGYGDQGGRGQRSDQRGYGQDRNYQGSYSSDGHRSVERGDRQQRGYGGQPQGYDYEDRGFAARAGDEVRSWFGDDEAERRREMDARRDQAPGGAARDEDYHSWRRDQIAALDRDYDEYRQENRSKFHTEFGSWRSQRQTQRDSLSKVEEHMEVIGSDGAHVGTVDKVRGDRILLTKTDKDADGHHHSIPSRWIDSIDSQVKIAKTADDAKAHWRDEERNQAMFADDKQADKSDDAQGKILNRSFSGTY